MFMPILLNGAPKGQFDFKPSLVQVITQYRTGYKPIPEPIDTQFNDAFTRPSALMS